MKAVAALGLLLIGVAQAQTPPTSDVILRAMQDELARVKQLKTERLGPPYYVEYMITDADAVTASATLGALLNSTHTPLRLLSTSLRVGDQKFDNTGFVGTGGFGRDERLPVEDSYLALRQSLWLATDRAYKTAQEVLARKDSAVKNLNVTDPVPNFSAAKPIRDLRALQPIHLNADAWAERVTKLSSLFAAYPEVMASDLEFQGVQANVYLATSEGTAVEQPDNLAYVRVRAVAQAADGMLVRDADVFQALELRDLPNEAELRKGIDQAARNVVALAHAPEGVSYSGPVMFEDRAAAQLFAQLLGDNLKAQRKPVAEPGRSVPFLPSELESRVGSKILPDWMSLVDDPTQTEWHGHKLFGHYAHDLEGTAPSPLALVDKGILKSFLLTRAPIEGFPETNGRARMPGAFGNKSPGFGNLFVSASKTVTPAALKAQLIDLVNQRKKPYGMLVRKLDFPFSGTVADLQRTMASMAQSGGGSRPVSAPLLLFRVYPDGREELVRGLRFRGLSTRSFKDIVAASDTSSVFNFMDSPLPFAVMGAGSFVTNASVIAPAVLFDELEFERINEDRLKLPIVPAPPLIPVS